MCFFRFTVCYVLPSWRIKIYIIAERHIANVNVLPMLLLKTNHLYTKTQLRPLTRTKQDCLLSCRWWKQNWRKVKTVFSSPQYIGDYVYTAFRDSLDLSPILFTPLTRTGHERDSRWFGLGLNLSHMSHL